MEMKILLQQHSFPGFIPENLERDRSPSDSNLRAKLRSISAGELYRTRKQQQRRNNQTTTTKKKKKMEAETEPLLRLSDRYPGLKGEKMIPLQNTVAAGTEGGQSLVPPTKTGPVLDKSIEREFHDHIDMKVNS